MDPNQLISLGATPFVIGVVQVFKSTFPQAPVYAVVATAFVTAEVMSEAITYVAHGDYVIGAILGITAWLASMGAWSAVKSLRQDNSN